MDHSRETMDSGALMRRAEQLIDQGRPEAARPLLAAVRSLAPPSSGLSVLAARLALCDGPLDHAEADLDRAVGAEPDHCGLRKCRAELRRRTGDMEGAMRDAAEAVVLDRDDPAAKALLGELLLEFGRAEDAVACLSEAVAARPRDIVSREILAQALAANGDMDAALRRLLEGIDIVPGSGALRNAAVLLCIRRRDFVMAEQLAEAARIDGVADASTYGLKGHALASLNRHDDAAHAYHEALKLAPGDKHIGRLAATAETAARAPYDFARTLFDSEASRFESHMIALGYRIPGLIRRHVEAFVASGGTGPVLDLGCGTGLIALALFDLQLGSFTGIDLSPLMLEQARAKSLYTTLREARLPAALLEDPTMWPLILAADLMCYFGALEEILSAVRDRLQPGGRFIFSVEELLPDHDGNVPGDGDWILGRQGRYGHSAHYVATIVDALGFRCLALERETLRYEAGGAVVGLLMALERPRDDA